MSAGVPGGVATGTNPLVSSNASKPRSATVRSWEDQRAYTAPIDRTAVKIHRPKLTVSAPDHPESNLSRTGAAGLKLSHKMSERSGDRA
jgi:hypothetical protein